MKSVLLVGLSNFGVLLAKQFFELGHHVMAVDKNEARVNAVMPIVTDAQIGDSTNEDFLRSLGINNFDVCVVTIGNDFQNSLETTSLLKELGGRLVVALADRESQTKFLLRNGADEVINPEKQAAKWAAIRYSSDHILDYIKLDDEYAIFEVEVPKDWMGETIGHIDIRRKYGITIMGIKQNGHMTFSISPDIVMSSDMTLMVLGEQKAIKKHLHI